MNYKFDYKWIYNYDKKIRKIFLEFKNVFKKYQLGINTKDWLSKSLDLTNK